MNKPIYKFEEVIKNIGDFKLGTKIKSLTGEIYELRIAENGQRKFSRINGTRLRFMSYDNIGKDFFTLEDNTEEIEELNADKLMESPYMANLLKEQRYDTFMELLKQSEVEIADKLIKLTWAVKEIRKDINNDN